jgi:hypothetical protein
VGAELEARLAALVEAAGVPYRSYLTHTSSSAAVSDLAGGVTCWNTYARRISAKSMISTWSPRAAVLRDAVKDIAVALRNAFEHFCTTFADARQSGVTGSQKRRGSAFWNAARRLS